MTLVLRLCYLGKEGDVGESPAPSTKMPSLGSCSCTNSVGEPGDISTESPSGAHSMAASPQHRQHKQEPSARGSPRTCKEMFFKGWQARIIFSPIKHLSEQHRASQAQMGYLATVLA